MGKKYAQIEYGWHQLIRNTTLNYYAEKLSNYNVYQLTYNNMKLVDPKDSYANFHLYSNFVLYEKILINKVFLRLKVLAKNISFLI